MEESMKRGLWTEEEDAKILEYVSKYGTGKWTSVPKKAGLRRCGKSCRLRWTNYLRPDLNHEGFTSEEEELIIKLHAAIGSRWSMIAQQLPGRTDNDVKNHWNTKLKKKLANMGIDPVTHKPFSQIFADYGSVGDLPKPGTRVSSLCLKRAIAMKSPKTEPESMSNDQTLGLLSQLQAINFVKHASSSIPNFHTEGTFPSATISPSSSTSTCSSVARDPSPAIPFDWNEFLLEDEFLPSPIEHRDCSDEEVRLVENGETFQEADVPGYANRVEDNEESFVEALMAKESEMIMEFPEIDLGDEFF